MNQTPTPNLTGTEYVCLSVWLHSVGVCFLCDFKLAIRPLLFLLYFRKSRTGYDFRVYTNIF